MFATSTMFYTSEDCQEDVITESLNTVIQNELKIPLGQNKITLTVEAISTNEYDAEFRNDSKTMLPSFCRRGPQFFDLFRFSECPSVTLNQDHYISLMRQTKDAAQKAAVNALFKFESIGSDLASTADNFAVQVCFESYRTVLHVPRKNNGIANFSKRSVVLFVALIFRLRWV